MLEVLQKVLTLVDSVGRLEKDVDRLVDVLDDVRERVTKVEKDLELARAEAKCAAYEQVANMAGEFGARFGRIDAEMRQISQGQKDSN